MGTLLDQFGNLLDQLGNIIDQLETLFDQLETLRVGTFKVSSNESAPLSSKHATECSSNVEDCTIKEDITIESNI